PTESVQTMSNIAIKTETALKYEDMLRKRSKESEHTITDAISQSVSHTALNLSATAIVTATESGYTARIISRYRPKSPILAIT
ncbi:pyruvate kinase alpha/beta domain-containing protein, partial [Pseudomonas sp. 2995-1]|uniref:pyruvate kinase alpha/beta domain-containing protein n=1 Tax=Pseudomonas sp. 2995-1 TaxID=1712679 RepID=UPI00273A6D63